MKTITIPYEYKPRDYQLEILQSNARFKIAVIHRRGGKSKTAINQQIARACRTKGIYYYILPTFVMAKRVAWDELVKQHIPLEIVEKKNESELAIYYKNGSIQRFLGADNPDSLRGSNPIDVVFDEYAEQDPRTWTEIIQPVLRENKGTATFILTPKGTNHAFTLLQEARNDPSQWFVTVKGVSDTHVFTDDEIKEIKAATPQAIYDQEYECKFLDSGTQVFKGVDKILYEGAVQPDPLHRYQIGVDLAKMNDYTVITVLDLMTFKVVEIERFNQVDWVLQKTKIELYRHKYKHARFVIDATGVGSPIYDDLSKAGLNIIPYLFTEKSREELLINLMLKIEQQVIRIPPYQILIDELKSFQYSITPTRRIKMNVPENAHDDTVFSLALSCFDLPSKQLEIDKHEFYDLHRLLGHDTNVNINDTYH